MKPGLIPLIIGGALLSAGLIIGGISILNVTTEVLEGSTIIDNTSLEPDLAIALTMKELPSGQQLLLALESEPADVPLHVRITQPDGTDLATYDIDRTPFTSTTASRTPGDHTLEIKNVGSRTVTVSGGLINSPMVQQGGGVSITDDPSIQSLVVYSIGILVGLVLIVAGIVLVIVGAIRYLGRNKNHQGTHNISP